MATRSQLQSFQSFKNYKSEMYLYGSHAASVPEGWHCRRHLHHMMFEVNLVLKGTQQAEIGGVQYKQREGSIILIPPMQLHSYKTSSPLSFFVLHVQIDDAAFLQLLGEAKLLLLEPGHQLNGLLRPELDRIMNLLANDGSKTKLFHTLYGMMDILEGYIQQHAEAPPHWGQELPVQIAREIERLIAAPIDDDPAIALNWLQVIADRAGFSRRHCYRVFREAYRMSPRDYLAVLRQQEAMHLLAGGDSSVEQVAIRIGYDNVQSFIRQFVKWTGMTPGAFRRQRHNDTIYLTPLELK
ncbi:AraC family transcriptional regulator [Paenibacillaceae bacterium]|nr:AraC family transcriptional regulator [Paenibacillaceae bacterium]